MKKLFSCISTIALTTTGITPVISCGATTYSNVTKQQETKALLDFARKNNITDINLATLNFINSKQSNNQQSILWDFTRSNNSKLPDHTQLLGQYGGIMLYHNKDKTFTLETKTTGNPFAKPARYIPGYYDSSFDISSYITGKATDQTTDFTIVANADSLVHLEQDFGPGGAGNIQELFIEMGWDNFANFPSLTLKDLANLSASSPFAWQITENHFAVIHVQKNTQTQNKYQIVWSNLATMTDKQIFSSWLINSFFWKQTTSVFHLWSSHEFLLELTQLYQLDKNPDNPWFSTPNLQKLFKQNPAPGGLKAGTIYLATVPKSGATPAGYQAFNASENELIAAIQSVIKTSASFQSFNTFVANNYRNNNLTFTYQNNTFTFDLNQSGALTNS